MRSSDWSSDVCSSDLAAEPGRVEQELVLWLQKLDVDEELDRLDSHVVEIRRIFTQEKPVGRRLDFLLQEFNREANTLGSKSVDARSEEHTSELQSLMRISYAVFCLKKKKKNKSRRQENNTNQT